MFKTIRLILQIWLSAAWDTMNKESRRHRGTAWWPKDICLQALLAEALKSSSSRSEYPKPNTAQLSIILLLVQLSSSG